jgi:hypothetical protein
VGKERATETYGGLPGFRIHVSVDPNTYTGGIPGSVDGIPVRISEYEKRGLACRDGTYSPVPGGIDARAYGFGTAACRVKQGGNWRMLTANHLVADCGEDPTGVQVSHMDDAFGYVKNYDENVDYATVSEAFKTMTNYIKDGNIYPVAGHATKSGVESAVTHGTILTQSGATTGTDTGTLERMEFSDGWKSCVTYESEGIKFDIQNSEGDSGSAVYFNDGVNEESIIYGLYSQWITKVDEWSCRGDSNLIEGKYGAGSSAYRLNNKHDIIFGNT